VIRVLAVDDQLPFLRAAAAVIKATNGFQLVGCASSGRSALDRLSVIGGDVDLVLLDIQLGDIDGVTVAGEVHARWPDIAIVYVSMLDQNDLPDESDESAAIGFVPKPAFSPSALEPFRSAIEHRRLT
jgi:DNA-binding NarL/FixJ family response regulator